jgi:hypothetical protein
VLAQASAGANTGSVTRSSAMKAQLEGLIAVNGDVDHEDSLLQANI